MPDATFARPDLTTFTRLDELGLVVTGQRLEPNRAVLACRVIDDDRWCRRCGCEGAPRDSVVRELAHEPFGWRPTTLAVTIRRYRCTGCGRVWRQDTTKAAQPRARLSRAALRWALTALVVQHLTVARVAEALAVAWNTANDAVLAEGKRVLISDPARFDGALTQAMREELVFRNVAALVRVPMPRSKKMPVWTVDEARRLLESARADGDPMYAGYVLLLTLGLRRGELLGLAWEDVDLEAGEALIAWQVQRVDHSLLRRHTKTPSSDAPLPLPEIAVRALERHRVEEARRRLAAGDMWGDCGLVFTTRLGDPVDPRNFHRDFKLRAANAGVPVVPIHSTRRTCASLLVALDVHPRVAMEVLRHSRISLTMEVYSQVSSASTRDALKRLGGWLCQVDLAPL